MGHIQDRWWKRERDAATGKLRRIKTTLFGTGLRYKVRYLDPDGRERSKMFPDKCKKQAEDFLHEIEGKKRAGTYIDPAAGKIRFGVYARQWLESQTFDAPSRNSVTWRLNAQLNPFFEHMELGSIKPTDIRTWIRWMQDRDVAASYQAGCFGHLSAILSAAVDDKIIRENPCRARTVMRPRVPQRKVVPWPRARVTAVHRALPVRYQVFVPLGAGCGLRQGECFGLGLDDIDRDNMVLHVVRQVRIVDRRPVFAPPKRGKTRDVPLPASVLAQIDAHLERQPPVPVALPWKTPQGDPVSVPLIIVDRNGRPVNRYHFNERVWRPAVVAAGVANPTRQDGTHALRHHYASVLLDAGESIKAVSEYLGHYDPGFTLRTYTHLMPSSGARARRAIDGVFGSFNGEAA